MIIFVGLSVIFLCTTVVFFIMFKHYKNKSEYYKFLYSEERGKFDEYRFPANEDGVYDEGGVE